MPPWTPPIGFVMSARVVSENTARPSPISSSVIPRSVAIPGAANRVTMTMLGLLQYVTPTLQFLLGVVVFREDMTPARWVGFILVWTALAIITVEGLENRRRLLRQAAQARTH